MLCEGKICDLALLTVGRKNPSIALPLPSASSDKDSSDLCCKQTVAEGAVLAYNSVKYGHGSADCGNMPAYR